MKPIFPLATSSWNQAEYDALTRVIESNQFSMGLEVLAFEDQFARQFGSKYAVMTNSGSSANLLIMAALRYTKNDKINITRVPRSLFQPSAGQRLIILCNSTD